MRRNIVNQAEARAKKRLCILATTVCLALILSSLSGTNLLANNYAHALTLGPYNLSPQLSPDLIKQNTVPNGTIIRPDFKAGTVIPGEYVVTLKNDSVPVVEPSPSGLVIRPNETALQSSVRYLEKNKIDVINTFDFNQSGVALVIQTPQPTAASPTGGGPGATGITTEFTLAKAKSILAPAQPQAIGDRVPVTNGEKFCEIATFAKRIDTCEVNRRGSVSSTIASSTQIVPTGVQRIEAYNASTHLDFGNRNAVVVIMDTGVSPHPDLNLNQALSKSFIGDNLDNWNHGSHVAGIVAAKDNNFGVRGVAPGAEIISVKVLDPNAPNRPGGTSTFLAGLQYIANLAQTLHKRIAVNLSVTLGANSDALNLAIANAVKEGVVFVAAAGNSGIDATTSWPGSIERNNAIVVSAIGDSDGKCGGLGPVIDVQNHEGPLGFLNSDDSFAQVFSNYGSRIDLAAPGVNILSTGNDKSYHLDTGTSMAAPHVTGGALLYLIENPTATPLEVENGLVNISVPSTTIPMCSGDTFGYFTGDVDGIPERALNVKSLFIH